MTSQVPLPSSSLSPTDLQNEIERLFGEVERLLDNPLATKCDVFVPTSRWAYPPSDVEVAPEEIIC